MTLGDVARVRDGIEEQRTLAFIDGGAAVGIDVLKQSGANTVAVIDTVKVALEKVRGTLPPGVSVTIVRDSSKFIHESVDDVVNSLVLGGVLTIVIVFLFLNSWRSTVITGLTLPISVISSFIVMNFMGMTLNMLTLMALSLSIGMLIDDAIVVRENIVRHLEMGKDHFTAAREGTAEIGLAVLATSLSIVAVFVPVAFMKGIVGRFFFSFGITVAWAVLVSLLVSFTLDPMLSSRWNDPSIGRHGKRNLLGRFLDGFNDWFNRGAERYRGVIAWALDHRKSVLALATAAFAAGIFVFGQLESSFIPEQDRGEFQVQFQSAPDASIEETHARLDADLRDPQGDPRGRALLRHDRRERHHGARRAGLRQARRSATSARAARSRSSARCASASRAVAGVRTAIIKAGDLFNGKELLVNVSGDDLAVLKRTAGELKEKVLKIPGIVDVGMTLQDDIPEYRFTVDRRKASDLGLTTAALVRTVGTLIGGTPVTTWENEDGDAVQVRLRLPAALRENPEQIGQLRLAVPGADGRVRLIPLGEVLSWQVQTTPSQIARQDLSRQVVIGANLDGLPIGTAVEKVKQAAATMTLPAGYKVSFSGEAEDMAESFGYMGEALLLAVLLVYLILAAQFESFLDPLAIMISLPLSIVGVAGMLLLTRDTISIMSFIGLIMLMGLVTKNAILLVAYAKTLRAGGMDAARGADHRRAHAAAADHHDHAAMIGGMLPMALGLGAGAEMRAPMARAVTGGLITSTLLTLLVVPVVYTLFDDFEAWILRLWSGSGTGPLVNREVTTMKRSLVPFARRARAAGGAARRRRRGGAETGPLVLTLEQTLSLAAEQNRDVQKAREYRTQVEARYVEERSAALPHFTVSGTASFSGDASQEGLGPPERTDNYAADARRRPADLHLGADRRGAQARRHRAVHGRRPDGQRARDRAAGCRDRLLRRAAGAGVRGAGDAEPRAAGAPPRGGPPPAGRRDRDRLRRSRRERRRAERPAGGDPHREPGERGAGAPGVRAGRAGARGRRHRFADRGHGGRRAARLRHGFSDGGGQAARAGRTAQGPRDVRGTGADRAGREQAAPGFRRRPRVARRRHGRPDGRRQHLERRAAADVAALRRRPDEGGRRAHRERNTEPRPRRGPLPRRARARDADRGRRRPRGRRDRRGARRDGRPGRTAAGDGREGLRTRGQGAARRRRRPAQPAAGARRPGPRAPRPARRAGQPALGDRRTLPGRRHAAMAEESRDGRHEPRVRPRSLHGRVH